MRFGLAFVFLLLPFASLAADIRVPAAPGALAALVEAGSVSAGDTLVLAPGDHGAVALRDVRFDPPVTVRADAGARLAGLSLRDVAGWRFVGLHVRSDGTTDGPLVRVRGGRDVVIEGFDIASGSDVERWSAAEWRAQARNGIDADVTNIRIANNTLRGVYHGITVLGKGAVVDGNTITWFAGDGIRALGDDAIYEGNTIDTCVDINDNHDDGIQSWSRGADGKPGSGVVRNVRIEGNTIRSGRAGALTCELQGIGFFDGMFEALTIRRNVIIVSHWHGITVMGGEEVTIAENLVVDADTSDALIPWISITAHKDGRSSRGGLIADNITQAFAGGSRSPFRLPQPGVRLEGNVTVASPRAGIEAWNARNR